MLSDFHLVLQSSFPYGVAFDPFSLQQDGLPSPKVYVGRGKVVQALVVAAVILVLDEASDLGFEIAGKIVIFEQDAVLKRLMPKLDLALSLRDKGRVTEVIHAVAVEPLCEIGRDVTGAIVSQ